jgi:CRP-like cAMP-binding protein
MNSNRPAIESDPPEIAAFVRGLVDEAARCRLPELFSVSHRDALYRLPDRHGVSVVALPTSSLSEGQLNQLMRYRLAQYLEVNFVDRRMVYEAGMEQEPLSSVAPDDIHVIAGAAGTGELLCYITSMAGPAARPGATLRDQDRRLFPVEQAHGRGIYNRLRVLPDLPIARVREWGRFVKNHRAEARPELLARAPVEVILASVRLLGGELHAEIDAVIGDFEESVAKQNMDFFHIPMVVIHGTVVHVDKTSYKYPMYRNRNHFPFAFLVSDLTPVRSRADDIERALSVPGKSGLEALFALKHKVGRIRSSLEPSEGLAPLVDTELPERRATMPVRRRLLDAGEALRAVDLFRDLSTGEAAVLGTVTERLEVAPGESVIRQGELGDDLFIIQAGTAEMRRVCHPNYAAVVGTLGPGDYFGEIALVTRGPHIVEVVATTAMTLSRLSGDSYRHYLAQNTGVQLRLAQSAATRAAETIRKAGC